MASYNELLRSLAMRARALRLLRNLRQDELAERAVLGRRTVARFERSGRASIENVLRIATVLGAEGAFDALFAPPKYRTLDEALEETTASRRQRARGRR